MRHECRAVVAREEGPVDALAGGKVATTKGCIEWEKTHLSYINVKASRVSYAMSSQQMA